MSPSRPCLRTPRLSAYNQKEGLLDVKSRDVQISGYTNIYLLLLPVTWHRQEKWTPEQWAARIDSVRAAECVQPFEEVPGVRPVTKPVSAAAFPPSGLNEVPLSSQQPRLCDQAQAPVVTASSGLRPPVCPEGPGRQVPKLDLGREDNIKHFRQSGLSAPPRPAPPCGSSAAVRRTPPPSKHSPDKTASVYYKMKKRGKGVGRRSLGEQVVAASPSEAIAKERILASSRVPPKSCIWPHCEEATAALLMAPLQLPPYPVSPFAS
ncbi:hypothetical protein AAFF_G00388340 [Aldrovandia affinis]|uniref:Uncharacterized protein n=1 Tax=Aldrovandia affinis TaxID=143900 RepID=A0AAD7SES1_9TELE|nr:hypothetical protein AAFF_G00388340 [Aldrovandia affinis]